MYFIHCRLLCVSITVTVTLKVMKYADTLIPVKKWDIRNALGMLGMNFDNN